MNMSLASRVVVLAIACLGLVPHAWTKPLPAKIAVVEPKGSAPTVKDGLEIFVTPAKTAFAEKEPIGATITFKNVSDKTFMLFESGFFWDWQIRFGDWQVVHLREVKRAYPPSIILTPGKSIQTTVTLDNTKDNEFHLVWKGEQLATPPPARFLPAGKYPLVIAVRLAEDVRQERLKTYDFPHWIGTMTTNPASIEITAKK